MATIGGRIMVAPTAKLTRDITNSATTIYLDSNLNIAPQELYMAGYKAGGVPQTEHMRIMSGPVSLGGGEYSYVVQRNIKATGNMYASNIGFEVNTSTWVFLYSASLGPALTRDTSIYNYGIASGRVNLPTGTGFSGVLSEYVTVTAGQLYTVSFWAKTTSVASLRFDSSTVTLALNGITVSGTTGWVRYTYNFTCATTEGVTFRAYDTNPTGGIFWLDEVIMEPKFAATGSAWYIDDANVNLGYKAGSGYIDLTSLTTIQGHYGPTVAVYAHTKDGGQPKPTAALGNLRSYVDYTADTMGWGVGNDLTLSPTGGFQGMTGDAVSGLRLFNVVQKMYSAGVEFLRLDTTTGLGLMSYLGTPSSYGTSPSINGLTFFRDSIGGNRSGQFSSAYNSGAGLGNDTFLVSYDSTVGAARTTIGVLDSVYAVSMGLYLRAYKASTSQFGYAQLGGNGGSVEVITAWANLGLGSAGMYFGDNSAGAGSGVPIINVSTGAFQNLNYGIVFHYSALQTGPSASRSEITNDVGTFKALMLLGNTAAGGLRRVSIFDQLSINQASYNLQLNVNGGVFLANITAPGTPSGGGYLYTNAGKLMYKGSSGTVTTVGLA